MKKFALSLTLLLCGVIGYTQDVDFNARGMVVGIGVGPDEMYADSIALASFVKSAGTRVTSRTKSTVSEVGGVVSRTFEKETGMDASMWVGGTSKKTVLNPDGSFTVYRYINKNEYVNECLETYNENLRQADSVTVFVKHAKNLLLGYYYKAYQALNTDMMNALAHDDPSIQARKREMLDKIKETYYGYEGYDILSISRSIKMRGNWKCVRKDYWELPGLPGFEYFNGTEWVYPSVSHTDIIPELRSEVESQFTDEFNYWSAIESPEKRVEYHFLYEEYYDGSYHRIYVPDEFYYLGEHLYFSIVI